MGQEIPLETLSIIQSNLNEDKKLSPIPKALSRSYNIHNAYSINDSLDVELAKLLRTMADG